MKKIYIFERKKITVSNKSIESQDLNNLFYSNNKILHTTIFPLVCRNCKTLKKLKFETLAITSFYPFISRVKSAVMKQR